MSDDFDYTGSDAVQRNTIWQSSFCRSVIERIECALPKHHEGPCQPMCSCSQPCFVPDKGVVCKTKAYAAREIIKIEHPDTDQCEVCGVGKLRGSICKNCAEAEKAAKEAQAL